MVNKSKSSTLPMPLFNKTYQILSPATKLNKLNRVIQVFIILTVLLSALWLIAAFWYQLRTKAFRCWPLIIGTSVLATAFITALIKFQRSIKVTSGHDLPNRRRSLAVKNESRSIRRLGWSYAAVWLAGAAWFIMIPAKRDRDWKPEVAQTLSYERSADHPNLVTLHNVRNFDWQSATLAKEHWQSRQIDLSKISGVDVINSYWMGPMIAHTLVSFRFSDAPPLTFSFEIRKERYEDFSALGGFFKQYELSLIASEERDIIYTRSHIRGEQVYLFPIDHLTQSQLRAMFEAYLQAAARLKANPAWYNTLTSNCTNLIFYMARAINPDALPWDYRLWVSGWLPNYLYDIGVLPNTSQSLVDNNAIDNIDNNAKSEANADLNTNELWTMKTWYRQAHINPKVADFSRKDNQSASAFSKLIRQGLPKAHLRKE